MLCTSCGCELEDHVRFCYSCGAAVELQRENNEQKQPEEISLKDVLPQNRVVYGNVNDAVKAFFADIKEEIDSTKEIFILAIRDAKVRKFKRSDRKLLIQAKQNFISVVSLDAKKIKECERIADEYAGLDNKNINELFSRFDAALEQFDKKADEMAETTKAGALGSSEAEYSISEFYDIFSALKSSIRFAEAGVYDNLQCLLIKPINIKKIQKAIKKSPVLKEKPKVKASSSRKYNSVGEITFVILTWVGFFVLLLSKKLMGDFVDNETKNLFFSAFFAGAPLGVVHALKDDTVNGLIFGSLASALSVWYMIFIPPVFVVMMLPLAFGVFLVVACMCLGWLFMVIDLIRLIFGKYIFPI
ncbi:MAG: zinc ribbon domain-containing protein [Ruminococcus sp.]|nr:zinc ribbon domain-containing protein [Ruminococcus sp.]